jgi:hypothetical protein
MMLLIITVRKGCIDATEQATLARASIIEKATV